MVSFFPRLLSVLLLAAGHAFCSLSIEGDATFAFDNFRSLPEGSWEGNNGAFLSLNLKVPLPSSFLVQLAGSYGLYDWREELLHPTRNQTHSSIRGF